jgi:hypothetical protein
LNSLHILPKRKVVGYFSLIKLMPMKFWLTARDSRKEGGLQLFWPEGEMNGQIIIMCVVVLMGSWGDKNEK